MTTLPCSSPKCTAQPNGWQQLSFTLTLPFHLDIGARLQWGEQIFAPWRIQGQHVDCLAMPHPQALDISAPILLIKQGQPLPHIDHSRLLLSGRDLGIADLLLAAQHLKPIAAHTLVLLQAEPFPFTPKPARFLVSEFPALIASWPLLDDWGFANRLASDENLPGCYPGNVAELINTYVNGQTKTFYNLMF